MVKPLGIRWPRRHLRLHVSGSRHFRRSLSAKGPVNGSSAQAGREVEMLEAVLPRTMGRLPDLPERPQNSVYRQHAGIENRRLGVASSLENSRK